MSDFLLLRPWWLLLLLPIAALAYHLRYRRSQGPWSAIIDPALLPSLRALGVLQDGSASRWALLPLAVAAMLCLALSGPAQLQPGALRLEAIDPIILVLDLSPSLVGEEAPLNDLKVAAAEILAQARGRPVGIMLFAGDAYMASAPSNDPQALQGIIAVLARDTLPVAGSRPDIALSQARDMFSLKQAGQLPNMAGADLVVISDGGGIGPRAVEEAARLRSDGARIWGVVSARNAQGAPPPDLPALQALAQAGGGAAFAQAAMPEMMDRIERNRRSQLRQNEVGDHAFRDYGPYLLPVALLLLFPLFRRRQ